MKFLIGFRFFDVWAQWEKEAEFSTNVWSEFFLRLLLLSISYCHLLIASLNHLDIFAFASFMKLDKHLDRLLYIDFGFIKFIFFRCFHSLSLLFCVDSISTDLFAINSKRISPRVFCLWSSVLHIRMPSIQCYFVSANHQWFAKRCTEKKVNVFHAVKHVLVCSKTRHTKKRFSYLIVWFIVCFLCARLHLSVSFLKTVIVCTATKNTSCSTNTLLKPKTCLERSFWLSFLFFAHLSKYQKQKNGYLWDSETMIL